MSQVFRMKSTRLPGDSLRQRQTEWKVWYEGVPERIANFYTNWIRQHTANGRFWGNMDQDQLADVVHMPLAGDIAATSANLLFSEPPEFGIDEANREANRRMEGFITQNKINQRLLHAGELCAAMGGVYLKIDIEPDEDYPVLTVRYPEHTEPEFRANGDLKRVRFSRIVHDEKTYRLYELREMVEGAMVVTLSMFELKDSGKDGKPVDLSASEETKDLQPQVTYPDMQGLGAVYIPNSLPNRMFPESDEGISDFAQSISLLDSLDEAWTSWMNDLTLGKGKTFVDQELLKSIKGDSRYDPHQRAYIQVDMAAGKMGEGYKPIESVQHDIRVEEHMQTCSSLVTEIITRCGYSPQSFGIGIEGRAESGTAIRLRERKSMLLRQKKARYWVAGLKELLYDMQLMDWKSGKASPYTPAEVEISLGDSIITDPKEISETVRNLKQAASISTQAAVEMAHPDWGEVQVKEEVKRILQEEGLALPNEQIGG